MLDVNEEINISFRIMGAITASNISSDRAVRYVDTVLSITSVPSDSREEIAKLLYCARTELLEEEDDYISWIHYQSAITPGRNLVVPSRFVGKATGSGEEKIDFEIIDLSREFLKEET
tara:strand:- start:6025 stop:6378 length:354 start_codon:yes stop_codon:yes gene_type:complete